MKTAIVLKTVAISTLGVCLCVCVFVTATWLERWTEKKIVADETDTDIGGGEEKWTSWEKKKTGKQGKPQSAAFATVIAL